MITRQETTKIIRSQYTTQIPKLTLTLLHISL